VVVLTVLNLSGDSGDGFLAYTVTRGALAVLETLVVSAAQAAG
jgi:hypothetical protein